MLAKTKDEIEDGEAYWQRPKRRNRMTCQAECQTLAGGEQKKVSNRKARYER